ncbi:MAG: exodeoxyribonuclease VII small subunit [Paracoccaceae bacterium]|jgi:exodeoxyribonuclease VII small subunit
MTKPAPPPTPVEKLTYEQALTALEEVVTRLERGDVSLDESIGLYERGAALKARCEAMLSEAEMKVAQITKSADGALGTAPLPGA